MKQKNIYLILLISSFALVLIWIVFTVYHNSVTSTIPEVLNIQITQIKPDFDLKTISDIKIRKDITPIYTFSANDESEQVTPSPAPAGLTTPEQASPEGSLSP